MAKKANKVKEYSLSAEEKTTIDSLAGYKFHYEYIASLIDRDIYVYMQTQVKKRLGLGSEVTLNYDKVNGKITVLPGFDELVAKAEEAKK